MSHLKSSSYAACCIAPFITTLSCCAKTRMRVSAFTFQLANEFGLLAIASFSGSNTPIAA